MKLPSILPWKFRKLLIQILWMTGIWVVALNFLIFLRFAANPDSLNPYSPNAPVDYFTMVINVTRGGIFLGICYGLLELIFERRVFRAMSYGKLILIKSAFYIIIYYLVFALGNIISFTIHHGYLDFNHWLKYFLTRPIHVSLSYVSVILILINIAKQINLKFGPGNLLNLILGRYHKPRQDHRIFMFIDLKSSVAIAQKLGHIQFSSLIQDCFTDLTIVRDYKAEIYQYIGDEVVLSWSISDGLENLNCIKTYFRFQQLLESRSDFYMKKYGLIPFFKAGLNVGDVTIAEVGQIKREIAFHGDTLNTASSIQGKCNYYNEGLLLSQALKEMIEGKEELQINLVGEVMLGGKTQPLNIYSIN